MVRVQRAGHISDVIGGVNAQADIRLAQGRLRQAMRTYERGLQLAIKQGEPMLRGTADMYVGMSELHLERNDLKTAKQHLLCSKELGEHNGFPQYPYRWRVAMARICEAEGDLDGALALLDAAERLYVSDFFPNVRPIAALKARVLVAQGRLDEAFDWTRERHLAVTDELSYLREFEHITLARVLVARYRRDRADHFILDARGLLARLLQAAEAGAQGVQRMGSVIEILVVQALAHQLQGDLPAARNALQRALTLAAPEEYVRLFVREGLPMAQLLREIAALGDNPASLPPYIDKLLAALGVEQPGRADQPLRPTSPASPTFLATQPLVEPLSQRELDVLRLFKSDLSGPEIAQELVVALSTVRTHTKRIYEKLNVDSRRAAVKRASELGLI